MEKAFMNKVVLVTGAGSGIGKAVALKLAAAGAKLALADINITACEAVMNEIQAGNNASIIAAYKVDVTKPESCKQLIVDIAGTYGILDCMAHCAGVLNNAPFTELSKEQVDFVIDVNLKGALYIMQAAGQQMLKQKHGKICLVASKAGKIGTPTLAHYTASKFGVIGLVQTAAMEWGREGVYVNCICPGEVDTPMLRKSYEKICEIEGIAMEEQLKIGGDMSIVGRISPSSGVADAMMFLMSEYSNEIMGQSVNADGGIVFH